MKNILLVVALVMSSACASTTPPAPVSPAASRAAKASQLIKDITALSSTAINLNALDASNSLHLSDAATSAIRTWSLTAGVFINAWGNGASTLTALQTSVNALTPSNDIPADILTAAQAVINKAITDHGAGASPLVTIVDSYNAFRLALPVSAAQHPQLTALLAVLDGVVSVLV